MFRRIFLNRYFAIGLIVIIVFVSVLVIYDRSKHVNQPVTVYKIPTNLDNKTVKTKATETLKENEKNNAVDEDKGNIDKAFKIVNPKSNQPKIAKGLVEAMKAINKSMNSDISTDNNETENIDPLRNLFSIPIIRDLIANPDIPLDEYSAGEAELNKIESEAFERWTSAPEGTKSSYDALDDMLDVWLASDNINLRIVAALIPREINGKPVTMWEAYQRHVKRMNLGTTVNDTID